MKDMARRRPPSYHKYKKEHPTVSFILTRELKEILDNLKGDKSYGQTVKQIIESKIDEELAKKLISKENELLDVRERFIKIQKFKIPCSKCKKPVLIANINDPDGWNEKIYPKLKEMFGGYYSHIHCPEEN